MTIDDFLYYCVDAGMLDLAIYDGSEEEVVWQGPGDEVPDEYLYEDLDSYDCPTGGVLTVNIHC